MELLCEFRLRAGVGETRKSSHRLEVRGDRASKRARDVRERGRISLEARRAVPFQRVPCGRVQTAGDGQAVDLLKCANGVAKIVAIQAVDLARRDVRPVEQDFGLRDQRPVSLVRLLRRALSIEAPRAVGSGIATAAGDAAKPQSTVMTKVRIMR